MTIYYNIVLFCTLYAIQYNTVYNITNDISLCCIEYCTVLCSILYTVCRVCNNVWFKERKPLLCIYH